MKKWMLYLCVAVLAFSLTACGRKKDPADASTESGAAGESSPQGGTEPEDMSGVGQGASPEEAEAGWSEEMTALRAAVVGELGDNYWPDMQMPAEYLEMTYGLSSDMYEDYMGEMPMMSAHVDTLLIVKAAEGQEDAVEEALQAYHRELSENGRQYPMNLGKVQAGEVERIDDYVCFVLLGGDTMDAQEQGDEAVIAHCREQNQRAIDAIRDSLESVGQ